MNILIAPGAFKNSLSATQAAECIARGLKQALPEANLTLLPIADGGNGTLDAWLVQGGTRHTISARDPLMRSIQADYGLLPDGKTAVIEMALASGMELLADSELNPMKATTYGTGELLQHALENGARRFIIGMGGSATVDGAAGALRALGIKLLDASGAEVPHGGGALTQITTIDASALDPRWQECEIIIASDVENLLLGDTGAAAIFAPQKGALPGQVKVLEENLRHFAELIAKQHGDDIKGLVGGGAAGGLSAGLIAFLGGRIESGIDLLLKYNHFVERLKDANLVITGEGQMDEQTVYGKGPIGVARLAKEQGVPTIALVGGLNVHDTILHEHGIQAAFSIVDKPMPLSDALANAVELLERSALRIGYLLSLQNAASQANLLTSKTQLVISIDAMGSSVYFADSEKQQMGMGFEPGGVDFCQKLIEYLHLNRSLLVGRPSADRLLRNAGSVMPLEKEFSTIVTGQNVVTGIPEQIEVTTQEIREAIEPVIDILVGLVASQVVVKYKRQDTERKVDKQVILKGEFSFLKKLDGRLQIAIREKDFGSFKEAIVIRKIE
jgi:glycerate 2-kinase